MLLRWPGVHFDFCVLGTHGGVVLIPSASGQVWPYYHSTRGAAGILPVQQLSAGEGTHPADKQLRRVDEVRLL